MSSKIKSHRMGLYPYATRMSRAKYEAKKEDLQAELLKVQHWALEEGHRFVILFEGRDAAGKGGTIKRFMEHLNPRHARVVALTKPSDVERTQWYFQRYIEHFPSAGEMVLFDRSWYNRAGVEHVMNFCDPAEYKEFMDEAPVLERLWIRSGIHFTKYWFSVTQVEQKRRFESREIDRLKQWKLSPIDREGQQRWDEYTEAKDNMFYYTNTPGSPWVIVKSDDKKRARIECMRHFLSQLDYPDKNEKIATAPDPNIVSIAPFHGQMSKI